MERGSEKPSAQVAGLILGVLAVAICVWRIRYFNEPLENDLTIRMAYAARGAAGARYYADLLVFGPAGTLWINEIFYRLFGASELAMYMMGCTFSVLTLLGVYRCARLLTNVPGGLVAAVTWTLVGADLFTQANQPNAEVFINAALVWAFALLLIQRPAPSRSNLIMAGMLFFAASSIKHFIAVTPLLAALFAVLLPSRGSAGTGPKLDLAALRAWAIIAAAALAAWAVLLGWYAATGRLPTVLDALFGSSVAYATQQQSLLDSLVAGIKPFGLLPPPQLPFIVLYACLLAAIIGGFSGSKDARWRLMFAWMLGTWLSVSLSGRFYPHYYMLWLPLISIGTGAAFCLAQTIRRQRLGYWLCAGIVLAVLAVGVRQVSQLVRYDAETAVLVKYGYPGAVFAEIRTLGKRLAASMALDTSVFEIGAHGLYFYAARPAPGPFVDSLYGIDSAFPAQYRERMLPALLQSPPDVLVVRRSILHSNSDVALRAILGELLGHVAYVEDKAFSGQHLMVLRRQRPDASNTGG